MRALGLSDLLAEQGILTQAQREEVLALETKTGRRPVSILLDGGFLTETQIISVLEDSLGLEDAGLDARPIPPEMARVLPRAAAEHYAIVPVQATWTQVQLAMADPLDQAAIDTAHAAAQRRIVPLAALRSAVERTLLALYGPRRRGS